MAMLRLSMILLFWAPVVVVVVEVVDLLKACFATRCAVVLFFTCRSVCLSSETTLPFLVKVLVVVVTVVVDPPGPPLLVVLVTCELEVAGFDTWRRDDPLLFYDATAAATLFLILLAVASYSLDFTTR